MEIREGSYLTPKAVRVMDLLAWGWSISKISRLLSVSKNYVRLVRIKTGFPKKR